ncbi:MAG: RNA polymerase sigma factor [Phycisphaerae bacterium]|nr:RNA polymerase sigma factor [Phycisphaerae bacterium]
MEMDNVKLYRELVLRVRQGEQGAQDRLAAGIRGPLQAYVYRITMRDDLTQDIVQESLLEMFKILGKLSDTDRFWPWLCKIALNKIRNHHRIQQRRKQAILSKAEVDRSMERAQHGLENLVTEEFKQIVRSTMDKLQPNQRAVLSMRCYENMSYAQIAEIMDSTELNVRLMFYRGKKQLQKYLSRHGFGRGALISALVIFGKMTAPDTATAAGITVLPSAVEVGAVAATIGALTSKTAVVSLTAVGIITAGAIVAHSPLSGTAGIATNENGTAQVLPADASNNHEADENWFFYPEGPQGPVMMRLIRRDDKGQSFCQWLQNDDGSYYYETGSNTVHITAHRNYNEDLSVRRLPTDSAALTGFLNKIEGRSVHIAELPNHTGNMLIVTGSNGTDQKILRLIRNYDVLQEEHFQYSWPAAARRVDGRDTTQTQGYCWFTVAGTLGGQDVKGTGFVPLYYNASKTRPAWVSIQAGSRRFFDNGNTAVILGQTGNLMKSFPGGTFLKGLSRPWMGLHTIDTVRRDAAEFRVPFEIGYIDGRKKAQITLKMNTDEMVYVIDLDHDKVETVISQSADGRETGRLDFSYFKDPPRTDLAQPPTLVQTGSARESLDTLWLFNLSQGKVMQ